jgi:hypothetical protein
MATGARYAGVAAPGGGFINLLTGKPGVATGGALTTAVLPGLGLATACNQTTRYVAIANPYADTPTATNFAAILTPTANNGFTNFVFATNGSSGGGLTLVSVRPGFYANGVSTTSTLPVLTLNQPYFIAVSISTTGYNWVSVNLVNGRVSVQTSVGAMTMGVGTATWTVSIASGNSQANATIAAVAYSVNNFLSARQLRQWAQAPWDFWYPPKLGGLVASVGVAAAPPTARQYAITVNSS